MLTQLPAAIALAAAAPPAPGFPEAFAEVHRLVTEHFFDPDLRELDWAGIGIEYADRAAAADTLDEFGVVVNEMLARLETSHTRFFTAREPRYYQLLAIFRDFLDERIRELHPDNVELRYAGVGMFTVRIDGETFVRGVLEGGPGHAAGLRVGDRIVSVDGGPFHPIGSFEGRVDRDVEIVVQRTADPDGLVSLVVRPEMIDPEELFLTAMDRSITVHERGDARIGYVHLWSFAGPRYTELLDGAVAFGPLRHADALVIDLRGGWGGANPKDLSLFNDRVPIMSHIARDGTRRDIDFQWRRPAALLVDEGSRSGKEVYAYGFRKHGIGPVVGARTAGAVVGGRPFPVGPGMLLYLAVIDVLIDDERLEGRGVEPDITVTFEVPYANGADPQLEAALRAMSEAVVSGRRGAPDAPR